MPSRRVTLPEPRALGHLCTMDTTALTTVLSLRRRDVAFSHLARRARALARVGRVSPARPGFRVDETRHVQPDMIDRDAWLEWGRAHLTPEEFARRERAVEADRAGQRAAV
jgi:hypothetical protein